MPVTRDALVGAHVLVVEDEFYVAMDLMRTLEEAGATVVGPVSSIGRAIAVVQSGERMDGAVLDVNVQGEAIDPVADALHARGVPMVFETGYGPAGAISSARNAPVLEKPTEAATLLRVLREELDKATEARARSPVR